QSQPPPTCTKPHCRRASPLRALPRRGNTAREEVPGDGHQSCRCRSNRPAMEQLLAFLRAAPDFEFSVVENTHKIITRIHEPTFEWKNVMFNCH
uniref:Uncharacterized protein n=1 Tax=Triticum urartu TaxID=4572 RepID=A0A8R7QCE2_TRIUA